MTVSAHGRRIVVHVNGYKTADLKNDQGRLDGHLGLQLHGGQDMEVMPTRFDLNNGILKYDDMQVNVGNYTLNFHGQIGLVAIQTTHKD